MKILWISVYASWTGPLLKELSKNNDVTLIMSSPLNKNKSENNITIYNLNISDKETKNVLAKEIFDKYKRIIDRIKPDIIHIHGTEKNYGQLLHFIENIPIVVSIQGILGGYIQFGEGYIKEEEISQFRTIKNFLHRGGYRERVSICQNGYRTYEKDILSNGKYFFCRTNWDKAWVMFSNPNAKIYQGEELLRQPFYDKSGSWNYEECSKHTIFMPSGFNPIKGLHIALKTVVLLKKFFPNVKLVVPGLPKHILAYEGLKARIIGEEFVNYCKDIIKKNHIEENVVLLDRLDAEGMAREMKNANVFLSPSTIDNSPNAVGEAMMVGCPIVCTPVGGTTSFMKDEQNCLLSPAGDEYIAAYQIKRLFDDQELASRLGKAAHQTALKRHDKEATVKQYIDAYENIIQNFKSKG